MHAMGRGKFFSLFQNTGKRGASAKIIVVAESKQTKINLICGTPCIGWHLALMVNLKGIGQIYGEKVHGRLQAVITICNLQVSEVAYLECQLHGIGNRLYRFCVVVLF